jgi:hypothetical protein
MCIIGIPAKQTLAARIFPRKENYMLVLKLVGLDEQTLQQISLHFNALVISKLLFVS